MTDAAKPTRPRLYRVRDESVWALIRQRYLSGETQKGLAIAYDVPVCTIQKRIQREGWSKRAAIGIRPTFGGMAAPQAFELIPPSARWPEAYEAPPRSDDAHGPGERWTSLKDPPPPSMQRWPHPLPGMGPMRRPQWEPPAGYGPTPPHLVPPDLSSPAETEAGADPEPAPSPAEAADQATAAAGRAVAEGRYDEAQKLARLADSLRRLASAPGAGGSGGGAKPGSGGVDPGVWVEDEEAPDEGPVGDRLLNCTMNTCAVRALYDRVQAKMRRLFDELGAPLTEDLIHWADMAQATGTAVDEDVAELALTFRAEGLGAVRGRVNKMLGPIDLPPRPAEVDMFRR